MVAAALAEVGGYSTTPRLGIQNAVSRLPVSVVGLVEEMVVPGMAVAKILIGIKPPGEILWFTALHGLVRDCERQVI